MAWHYSLSSAARGPRIPRARGASGRRSRPPSPPARLATDEGPTASPPTRNDIPPGDAGLARDLRRRATGEDLRRPVPQKTRRRGTATAAASQNARHAERMDRECVSRAGVRCSGDMSWPTRPAYARREEPGGGEVPRELRARGEPGPGRRGATRVRPLTTSRVRRRFVDELRGLTRTRPDWRRLVDERERSSPTPRLRRPVSPPSGRRPKRRASRRSGSFVVPRSRRPPSTK